MRNGSLNFRSFLLLIFVNGFQVLASLFNGRFGKLLTTAKFLYDLSLLKFALETLQSLINGFTVFYINDEHTELKCFKNDEMNASNRKPHPGLFF